ncbi:hypothetical protein [Paenibacillus prosopidis]|uniref:hypothetical protein n=1 Tax=Paenibacillus prosopidis TaxID=630520 RepID=UPI0015F14E7E|nr:hypothetical protein [Paenibacillus prosopidis]
MGVRQVIGRGASLWLSVGQALGGVPCPLLSLRGSRFGVRICGVFTLNFIVSRN